MNKLLIPLAIAFSSGPILAKAASLDLTTFTPSTGINSSAVVTPTLATLLGTASITAQVSSLTSFEWQFTAGDIYAPLLNDFAYFTTSAGTSRLSDIQAVGSFGSSGWQSYVFATPYNGNIILGVQNALDDENGSELRLRNLITSPPVPEPASYALLLAGLGLVGAIAKRGSRFRATI